MSLSHIIRTPFYLTKTVPTSYSPLEVIIKVTVDNFDDEADDDDEVNEPNDNDDDDDDEQDHLPLKKRRRVHEGLSSTNKECAICLDEFLEGGKVASMPCTHVLHDGCIIKWLKTRHLCPLCRFQMPT
ncbi:E3 ubiquitin-protein ligase RING1-like [Gossypium raimondii]|uniref:E3 ubiquitin-protein ligase RING1-like n=1 Tax=Gossypium raimondii TaxID=29730 RepID=UPI00063AE66C|nr:E3 ubiquitin-protein ligase RING1-like [Gossypium raimondii]